MAKQLTTIEDIFNKISNLHETKKQEIINFFVDKNLNDFSDREIIELYQSFLGKPPKNGRYTKNIGCIEAGMIFLLQ